LQIGMLLTAILLMGLGSAIYIGVDAGAGPRDSLMLAIKRTTGVSIRTARAMIEVTVVTIGWLLGGTWGIRHWSMPSWWDHPFSGASRSSTSSRIRKMMSEVMAGIEGGANKNLIKEKTMTEASL
jgi:hypothetical protein